MSEIKTSRRNRHAAPIGIVFILLCIIGICTVFSWCYNATKYLADNTAQKTKYEAMLLPVVMFDPADFTDPTTCDNEFLLQSSLWASMLGENRSSYQYDEYNRLVIPASDVETMAAKLFGPNIKLEHKTIGDADNSYLYDEGTASYHVPVIAMSGFATPRVEKIEKRSDSLFVTVGYVPPTTLLSINYSSEGNAQENPSKYMLYEMREYNGEYYIYAVSNTDNGGNMHYTQNQDGSLAGSATDSMNAETASQSDVVNVNP